jgi:hypothetical protein
MNTSDRFVRFAAECEFMAKFTPSRENATTWRKMAARWLRIAELFERRNTLADAAGSVKRRRKSEHSWAH